ncbi:uncharacterized protein ACNLHF_005844 [Anomaloglossus baeobatrachus]|uniref:uncharacterized protein LOC142315607 n=1 Tax=Anomaloglossus baeobatrachus TaxID=238106 RepID=UPI003F509BEC
MTSVNESHDIDQDDNTPSSRQADQSLDFEDNIDGNDMGGKGTGWSLSSSSGDEGDDELVRDEENQVSNEAKLPSNNIDENEAHIQPININNNNESIRNDSSVNESHDIDQDDNTPSSGQADQSLNFEDNIDGNDKGGKGTGWSLSSSSGDEVDDELVRDDINLSLYGLISTYRHSSLGRILQDIHGYYFSVEQLVISMQIVKHHVLYRYIHKYFYNSDLIFYISIV